MSEYNYTDKKELTFNEYLTKVFFTMAVGLSLTALTALAFSYFYIDLWLRLGGLMTFLSIALIIGELVLAFSLSAALTKMSKKTTWICYLAYCLLTGLSLTSLFIVYSGTSIWMAFVMTSLMFITMAFIGKTTSLDLSKFSSIALSGLIAIIIATILNALIFRSQMMSWMVSYAGIIIFMFLIAYDIQKLRIFYQQSFYDYELGEKLLIVGAFQLYLDFINLFIRILQLIGAGRRKD